MRACVAGLREFPEVNTRLDTETNEIVLQHFVNLGFAAQTDTGLMVPNIKRADRLSMLGIAVELNRLAQAVKTPSASNRRVTPRDCISDASRTAPRSYAQVRSRCVVGR